MTEIELLRRLVGSEQDVFAVRHQGRQLAARLGLASQDQIRLATALSEVSRRLLGEFGEVTVEFTVDQPDGSARPDLIVRTGVAGAVTNEFIDAIGVTRRLMDRLDIDRGAAGTRVTMARSLPAQSQLPSEAEAEAIRTEVAPLGAGSPMEELAEHNRQLMSTLEIVQGHRDELLRLNGELAETNRGVMALYNELSGELEATNRGVVALYAELDQRTNQARAANEAKTRFLANVSHELRAPVTAMVGLLRLIRDPRSEPLTAEQRDQLDLVDSSAHSLLNLVNELLDLAKAESGKLAPALEPTRLADIFATLAGTLRAVPRSDATALVVVEPRLPTVVTDPILLTQVLRNLLTNGLKFTPTGEVRLAARHDTGADTYFLVVSDTGIGIPPEEQERVFEEFHQVRHRIQASVTGTGLGLPYARRLVHVLGGTITLASVPGQGSTFTVALPVAGPAAAVVDPDDPTGPLPHPDPPAASL